jgi:hypothetical protein
VFQSTTLESIERIEASKINLIVILYTWHPFIMITYANHHDSHSKFKTPQFPTNYFGGILPTSNSLPSKQVNKELMHVPLPLLGLGLGFFH